MAMGSLTARDASMLSMERQFWSTSGAKEQAIRDQLGMTPVRYYARLNQLVDTEAALAFDPVLVNRLKRLRSSPRDTPPNA
jgi:hypothetical protein